MDTDNLNTTPSGQSPLTPDVSSGSASSQPPAPQKSSAPPESSGSYSPDQPVSSFPPIPPENSSSPPFQTVVASKTKSESLPVWFYILFVLVAVVFFFITFLLVQTLIQKQKSFKESSTDSATPKSNTVLVSPSVLPLSPTPVDEYLEKSAKTDESDELTLIESDLQSTELTTIKEDLQNFQD